MARLLILISEELQSVLDADQDGRISRALGRVNRAGFRILAIAPRPERWRPTRRSMDDELSRQQKLYEQLDQTGTRFDGIYYYPTSWFTQQRLRQDMYDTLARRAEVAIGDMVLITAFPKEQTGATEAGLEVLPIASGDEDVAATEVQAMWQQALNHLAERHNTDQR